MILQAWLTLPSCLASSNRPTLARITLRSIVIVRLLGKEGYREGNSPSRARGSHTILAGLSAQILANPLYRRCPARTPPRRFTGRQNHRRRHRSQQDPHARGGRGGDRPVAIAPRLHRPQNRTPCP